VAYGAAAVPETMGGAGLATRTRDPVEVAQLLAVLEREPKLRAKVLAGQRARLDSLGQAAVAERVREGLRPLLEGTQEPRLAGSGAPGLNIVCPGYLSHPEAPMSQLARKLAEQFSEARVLALSPTTPLLSVEPQLEQDGKISVWRFSPDQPIPAGEDAPLPSSSSLEMAVRTSTGHTVVLEPLEAEQVEAASRRLAESLRRSGVTHARG
jgi:hypothetical protein